MDILREHPRTSGYLVEKTGIDKQTINNYIRALLNLKYIFICSWTYVSEVDPNQRRIARPIYGVGDFEHAKKPKPKDPKLSTKEYYRRTVENPDKYPKAVMRRKKRSAVESNKLLIGRLKDMPASNPIEAMVSSVLVPRRKKND